MQLCLLYVARRTALFQLAARYKDIYGANFFSVDCRQIHCPLQAQLPVEMEQIFLLLVGLCQLSCRNRPTVVLSCLSERSLLTRAAFDPVVLLKCYE